MHVGSIVQDGRAYRIHFHVHQRGSGDLAKDLRFRDALRANPDLRDEGHNIFLYHHAPRADLPMAVDFARGYPRYLPHEGTAGARLARGEVDAVLLAGSAALVPSDLLALTARVPRAVVGPRASAAVGVDGTRDIVIDTGVAGIHEGGTAMRMDDVPLPLRAPVTGPKGAADIARAVARRVRELRGPSRQAAAP